VKIDEMFPSRWLHSDDLGGKRIAAEIDTVEIETFDNGDKKPMVSFRGAKKSLVLNQTNARAIAEIAGSDDSDKWGGVRVSLEAIVVDYPRIGGKGIRVFPASEFLPEPAAAVVVDDIPF
jgi:hypothetical protein